MPKKKCQSFSITWCFIYEKKKCFKALDECTTRPSQFLDLQYKVTRRPFLLIWRSLHLKFYLNLWFTHHHLVLHTSLALFSYTFICFYFIISCHAVLWHSLIMLPSPLFPFHSCCLLSCKCFLKNKLLNHIFLSSICFLSSGTYVPKVRPKKRKGKLSKP